MSVMVLELARRAQLSSGDRTLEMAEEAKASDITLIAFIHLTSCWAAHVALCGADVEGQPAGPHSLRLWRKP